MKRRDLFKGLFGPGAAKALGVGDTLDQAEADKVVVHQMELDKAAVGWQWQHVPGGACSAAAFDDIQIVQMERPHLPRRRGQ